jgi:hypothetical protein
VYPNNRDTSMSMQGKQGHTSKRYPLQRSNLQSWRLRRSIRERYASYLPDTRLVLIANRFWYLPVPKPNKLRSKRQISVAACGALFMVSLIAADLLLPRAPLSQDINSFLRQLSKPSFVAELWAK